MRLETEEKTGRLYADFRTILAIELVDQGMIPFEKVTTTGTKYLMYLLPEDNEEFPYVHDPVCGDCGCPRVQCLGIPPLGWDDLVPEDGCNHYIETKNQTQYYSCRTAPQQPNV